MEEILNSVLHRSLSNVRRSCATPASVASTFVLALLIALSVYISFRFFLIDAVWTGGAEACRVSNGACWPFVAERGLSMLFGFLPKPLQAGVLGAAAGLLCYWVWSRQRRHGLTRGAQVALCGAALIVPLIAGLFAGGAPRVADFGGVLLTLIVSGFALLVGLPIGIGLALMRTSRLPVVRGVATIWIEIWRGIPTIVALFFTVAVFPLLVPRDVDVSKLLRALLAFTALTSAMFAEAIRGGLLSVPDQQREAAQSLGLGAFSTLSLVILPQALRTSLPNIVNISVALIKETTLILLVGLYDLFGIVQTAIVDPKWTSGSVTATGYVIAAGFYISVCWGLSKLADIFDRDHDATKPYSTEAARTAEHAR